jgi:O-antigen chain-terminating methyltransferase
MIIDKTGKITNVNDLNNSGISIEKKTKEIIDELSLFQAKLNELYDEINKGYILEKNLIKKSSKRFTGSFINLLKRVLNKCFYPPLAYLFETQNKFNSNITKLLNSLREELDQILSKVRDDYSNRINKISNDIEQVNKKLLELNHYRYTEIKNVEHLFHTEIPNIKAELSNIVYTYFFLQKNVQELISKYEMLRRELQEGDEILRREIHKCETEIKKNNIQIIALSNLKKSISEGTSKEEVFYRNAKTNDSLADSIYFNLEDKLRGSEEEIAFRQHYYLEYLRECQPVLDVGCGRGEMLLQLRDNNIQAFGIDSNTLMVEYCLSKNLNVVKGDAIPYLISLNDKALGAIFASHFIEHLSSSDLMTFLTAAYNKLKEEGILIIETPNVLGLYTLSRSFYLDITHVNPIHPNTLELLLELLNFKIIKKIFFSEWDESLQLHSLPNMMFDENYKDVFKLIQSNFTKLNEIIFAPRDYAIIAKK